MSKKCPDCGKFLTEVTHGWICSPKCGYEDLCFEEPQQENPVDKEIYENFWNGTEPTTEAAQEYCDYWHGG